MEGGVKMPQFRKKIMEYREEFLNDLEAMVSLESIRDLETSCVNAPFGAGIRSAFDCFLKIGERCGFKTEDFDGYACHAVLGDTKEYVGILGHLDVVGISHPKQWKTLPFQLYRSPDDVLFGRGVNDDKGPLLAALYAVRIIKDMNVPLRRSIRVIAGGAEETTWECMKHYFLQNEQPVMGFSPDGNFPVVNGEKGIVKYDLIFPLCKENRSGTYRLLKAECDTLENYVCSGLKIIYEENGESRELHWTGKEALSRNPQRGENVLWKFAEKFQGKDFVQNGVNDLVYFLNACLTEDFYGKKIGLYSEDDEMGATSVCPTGIFMDENAIHLYLDIRYPKSTDLLRIQNQLQTRADRYGFSLLVMHQKRLLYVPKDSELIIGLKNAYEKVTGEKAEVLTKGGASYARTLEQGVAFGASFEGEETNPHMPNECMKLSSLLKAMEIYCEALWNLAV